MNTTRISAPARLPFVDIEREFDAPRDVVFRAHTEPDLLAQWLGPRQYEMVVDRYEVRDGGTWRYIHRGGGEAYAFHGVFHGTPTPDLMVQTFEYEGAPGHVSLEALTMEERDGRTIIRGHSTFQSVEDRDAMVEAGMEVGIREGYERLDELVARLAPVG